MFFSRMSVKKRLLLGFGIMILLVMISGLFSAYLIYQTSEATGNLYQHSYAGSTAVMRIENNVLRIHRSMKDVALAIDQEGIDAAVAEVNGAEEKVYADLDGLKEIFPGIEAQIEALKKLLSDWKPIRDLVIVLMSGGSRFEAASITKGKEADHVSQINTALNGLLTIAGEKAEGFMAASRKAGKSSLTAIYILVGVSILVGILLALAVSSSIINPLRTIVGFSRKVADGDLKVEADRRLRGEFGQTQEAVARMVAILKEGREEIEKNVEGLNKILSQVSVISNHVAEGSGLVSESSQALSRGATQQAASLQEITSAMTELGSQTKVNAENASEANRISDEARGVAESGNHQMKEMVTAMSGISDSSKEIARIIKTIDDIAFQTNLLALNAAVEAARAGVHGKGFAVVAQEVRNLAGRSAKAAHETAELIESAVNNVENGTRIVNSTAEALDEIVRNVNQVSDLVASIAQASDEQNNSISQINQGLGQVEKVTHQNTASAEETASAAEELSGQAAQLKKVVSRFQLVKQTVSHKRERSGKSPTPPKRLTRGTESFMETMDNGIKNSDRKPTKKKAALDDKAFEEF